MAKVLSCYLPPLFLPDMDEDFRECLEDYVNGLIRSATNHVKKDQEGAPLTGAQLAARIKVRDAESHFGRGQSEGH